MMERAASFMTYFISGSLALLISAVICLIFGLQKQKKGQVIISVCLFLLLIGAWLLLGIFLTKP